MLHFAEQINLYQSQLAVNLLGQKGIHLHSFMVACSLPKSRSPLRSSSSTVDEKGAEQELSEAYEGYLRHIDGSKIKYSPFARR